MEIKGPDMMRGCWWIVIVVLALLLAAGCVSRAPNTAITVTSDNLDDFTPVNTGSVDFYTVDFRIENPTNRTFENVEVQVTLNPVVAFCHIQSATFEIPSLAPREKKAEQIAFSEFSDLDCAYNFTSSVTSDQGW
ncbi:hypothetical protein [Methanoregula sp.]|uniref:hypothetical protein n=1 Tax=Methanoregula sp. TaxID=2052170 RepID=UPI0035695D32